MIYIASSTGMFSILGFSVQTWGFIVALGVLIALALFMRKANKKKVFGESQTLILFSMISAIICGRIAYILVNPS